MTPIDETIPSPAHPPHDDLRRQIEHAVADSELSGRDSEAGVDLLVNRVAEGLGVAVMLTITIIVFANAVMRYVFSSGLLWGDEIAIALVPWLAMLGMFLSVRRRQVIRIEHFVTSFPKPLQRLLKAMADLIAAVAFVYLAFVSCRYLALFGKDKTVYLGIPTYWFQSSLVIGGILLAGAFIVDAVRSGRDQG